MAQTLADILYERFALEMLSWEPDLTADIYALSIFIDLDEADVNQFEVLLSYNTHRHVAAELPRARSPEDARWDFEHWLQDFRACVATHDAGLGSVETAPQVRSWLEAEGLRRSPEELRALIDAEEYDAYHDYHEALEEKVVEAAVEAARRLHETGIVLTTFGRHLPIILHQDELYPLLLEETRQANPEGLLWEFEWWAAREE